MRKTLGQHTDDCVRLVVEHDAPADGIWIGAESALPRRVSEHGHRVKKLALIAQMNPQFVDLAPTLFEWAKQGQGCLRRRRARLSRDASRPRKGGAAQHDGLR